MTTRACAQCGCEKPIVARGLCGRCYTGLQRTGKIDRYPVLGQLGRPKGARRQVGRYTDWRALAEDRKGEIDRLRARVKELEEQNAN